MIVKIPKEGSLIDCNNQRGITLLSVPSKILEKIIIRRMSDDVDTALRSKQAGFRNQRSRTYQIFALCHIIEQCTEWQRHLYVNFVDFEKAFNCIHRDSLWNILHHNGIPSKLVHLRKSFFNNFRCSIGYNNAFFNVKTEVRQGCVMSAVLYNVVIDWVMRKTSDDSPQGVRWSFSLRCSLTIHPHIQEKTDKLQTYGKQVSLRISTTKTETMTLDVEMLAPIKVKDEELH
jgi:hypothetical protein